MHGRCNAGRRTTAACTVSQMRHVAGVVDVAGVAAHPHLGGPHAALITRSSLHVPEQTHRAHR